MTEPKKVPVSVYAEMTPNPAVLKFVANKRLIEIDSVEFKNIEEAQPSPLASKLFHYPFVKEVFISGNYIAITRYEIVEWEDVTMELRELIRDFIAEGNEVLAPSFAKTVSTPDGEVSQAPRESHPEAKDPSEWDPIETKIAGLLDEYVRPAVESDGGAIKLMQYDNGVVKVLLQGACSGCPSSTQTLKQGIQSLLMEMLPGQVQDVVAVNG